MKKWQLQEAKNRFSRVAEDAATYGPQVVTKHGKDAVVILGMKQYQELVTPPESLTEFFQNSPLSGVDLERDREGGRKVDL